MRAPGGFSAGVTAVPDVLEEASLVAAGAVAASEGSAAGLIVGALAEFVVSVGGWAVIIIALLLVVFFRILEAVLYKIADGIPLRMGSPLHSFVHLVFTPLDNLELWVAERMADAVELTIHNLWTMLKAVFIYGIGAPQPGTTTSSNHAIAQLQAEYNDLYRKYNYLEGQVHRLQTVAPTTANVGTIPATLTERVRRLEELVVPMAHDVNVLHADYNTLAHNESVLNAHVNRLLTNLNAVRATQVNVQDDLVNVDEKLKAVEHELGLITPMVDASARQLHLMHPLEQLLYLGQVGINNLKRLEDNPCQCARYRDVPSDQSEELAVYEFLTNG